MKQDRKRNRFTRVAADAILRLRSIATDFVDYELPAEAKTCLLRQIDCLEQTLQAAFEFRQTHGPELGPADSVGYYREKLVGLVSFTKMAIDETKRGDYSPEKIVDNVDHYSYLVARLVDAEWTSTSKRPATDRAIKKGSFENREAMERLANR